MKKIRAVTITMLCGVAFAACPSEAPPAPQAPKPDTPAPEPTPSDIGVVFTDAAGRVLTRSDLEKADDLLSGRAFEQGIPQEARDAYARAQKAGENRRFDEALEHFLQAKIIAKKWPAPAYGAGWTFLLKGDITKALEAYRDADALAPRGYLATKLAINTLDREKKGQLMPATYMRFELQMAKHKDIESRRAFLKSMVDDQPDFPPAWWALSEVLEGPEEVIRAVDEGMKHAPDIETRGQLLINKAVSLDRLGDRAAAVKILGGLALDPSAAISVEHRAKKALLGILDGGASR